jgi:hypothetical protein
MMSAGKNYQERSHAPKSQHTPNIANSNSHFLKDALGCKKQALSQRLAICRRFCRSKSRKRSGAANNDLLFLRKM